MDEALARLNDRVQIDDSFLDERVLATSHDLIPWFADYANHLVRDIVPSDLTSHQRRKFMPNVKKFFLDEPYLFHFNIDGIIHRCVPTVEMMSIFEACYSSLVGGCHSRVQIAHKIL